FYAYVGGNPLTRADPSGLLFGGLVNAGECYGDSAAQYWADMANSTGNPLYHIPGAIAALWTPSTSDDTFAVLAIGAGLGSAVRQAGMEWSHWVPGRFIRNTTGDYKPWLDNALGRAWVDGPLNGNYRSAVEHA